MIYQNFSDHGEGKDLLKLSNSKPFRKKYIKFSSTIVKIKVLKLSNFLASSQEKDQHFFDYGEDKGTQNKQF